MELMELAISWWLKIPPISPWYPTPKIYSEAPDKWTKVKFSDISKGQPVASDLGIGEENPAAIISY